ncbi:cysteine-rich receptor-like protein kinase 44 [Salvia miltiorrhiza]|uniref:cysteine-rich receptor-like protein kinase 44 n=1 Tax=Salvia miltiorrhiza TaxID=226208 RepID=UPI0025AC4B87|nr:cysteine-rich receptor-like protein kinase 44 [Salvia miltiorrhiza]
MNFQTCLMVILINLSAAVTAQNYGCFGGNYTSNSTYATNLNSLISSLPPNINDNGFLNATAGQTPDRAYATALCRTDFQKESCRSCIREAADELLRSLCPNRRQGILFKLICTLRYSDESLSGGAGAESYTIYSRSGQARFPEQFNQKLRALLRGLREQAAAGGPLMKIAAGNETAPDYQTVFALVQCTPDLSEMGCTTCLISSEQFICCENNTGAVVYRPGCYLQFGVAPFYNLSRIEEVRAMILPLPPPVPAPPLPSSPGNGDSNTTRTVIIILVPIVASLLIAACVGNYIRKRLKTKTEHIILENDEEDVSGEESLIYNFKELAAATDNFSDSNKLGQGGFGAVYKGELQSGQQIAVKRLSRNSGQGELEFKNEVVLMAKLQHRNLVRLLGFSLQGTERLLVYEFVHNGSLDCFIFDPVKRLLIDWESRYKIIKGIAKGLVYLHEDSPQRIIHRDLKASNILLDTDNNPKISDFGMARLFEQDETGGNTGRIVGTYGYMAPEYAQNGNFSIKSDVFSFGVLMLEIISGQSNNSFKNVENGENVEYMLSFAWRNWCAGRGKKMIDPALMSTSGSLRDMLKCIHIGLMCVQQNTSDRPTMASVVVMLHSFSVTFPVPSQPAYFVPGGVEEMSRSLAIKPTEISKNEASITELYPR